MSELQVWQWVILIGWPVIGFVLSVMVMVDTARERPVDFGEKTPVQIIFMMVAIIILWPIYLIIIIITDATHKM